MRSRPLSRRTVLRGLGAAVALPLLDAMQPLPASGAVSPRPGSPNRLAFLYVPNGAHMADFTPKAEGADFDLPPILQPLAEVKRRLLVLSGLAQHTANANGDGPGDHARAMSAFLTGCQPRKTAGADIKVGVSADQVVARIVGGQTRLPSLEIGCDAALNSGNCDSGYSCAYSGNGSWRTESTPMAKEIDPKHVFDRLFSNGKQDETGESLAQRDKYRKSILDFALDDANRLRGRLGSTDRRKVDEYLSGVRELEQRISRLEREPVEPPQGFTRPTAAPADYAEHIRLMCDLIAVAFQGDLTRVTTFVLANEGSNRAYPFLEVPEGHHDLSHHGGDAAKQAKIGKINVFHASHLAYLLGKLESIPEGDGTLLDHAMIAYGSGIGDGNAHNHNELPILLAGGGCGTLSTGRHVRYPKNTPLNNLWLSLLDRMEADSEKLGDSTGLLPDLLL